MYDPIFAKSFSKHDRRRFGFCAFFISLVAALGICSTFKPQLRPLSIVGDAVNLHLSIDAIQDLLESNKTSEISQPTTGNSVSDTSPITTVDNASDSSPLTRVDNAVNPQVTTTNVAPHGVIINDTSETSLPSVDIAADSLLSTANLVLNKPTDTVNDTRRGSSETATGTTEPLCRILKPMADYCEIEGDVRIQPNSSSVFFVTNGIKSLTGSRSWHVQPYPRKYDVGAMRHVKNWTVLLAENKDDVPKCSKNHVDPAILFSVGGHTGNHFHDFTDVIVPIYTTSLKFKRDVHFLTTDTKPWWISKYLGLLNKLSRHEIINIDEEKEVHCYKKVVLGLKSHKELIIDPSNPQNEGLSMHNFRQFLRQTYSLERTKAIKLSKGDTRKPRLMIISRRKTRILTNDGEITGLAEKMGYEVVMAEAQHSTNLSRFAQIVNSCDVLMGIHGAGLTNMVFLPDKAVLIQIVPLGGIDWFAKTDFGEPSEGMKIRYLEYKIKDKESSLTKQYSSDDPVLKNPKSIHVKGWDVLRKIYLDQQNVTIDLHRFKGTLAKAMRILHH